MTEEDFNRIDDHLSGKLDFATLAAGKTDAEVTALREAVKEVSAARMVVHAGSLRQDLLDIHREAEAGATPMRAERGGGWKKWIGLAAAILLLVAVGLSYWLGTSKADRYAEYEYRDPGLPVVMGITDDPAFAEAMTQFKLGNYAEAQTALAGLAESSANSDTLSYYFGAAAYYAEDYTAAAAALQATATDATSLLRERAGWLLSLTYLKSDQPTRAREQLEAIAGQPGHRFAERATELLTSLPE